jgi:hypothetical protein
MANDIITFPIISIKSGNNNSPVKNKKSDLLRLCVQIIQVGPEPHMRYRILAMKSERMQSVNNMASAKTVPSQRVAIHKDTSLKF